ncbi:hypothetical protein KL928_003968 [Ogataea angusta]|uniref:Uncharacterized protein n=1 Tax=Pichia angusta TaxID=870730 RepID=A0AAN6DD89_PICAN|nr:uncharacterized protein KL928_003968 [Ogataea angusta]KAG7817233.1 hypothetical protein KL928_003968 [Ogataea angusta]
MAVAMQRGCIGSAVIAERFRHQSDAGRPPRGARRVKEMRLWDGMVWGRGVKQAKCTVEPRELCGTFPATKGCLSSTMLPLRSGPSNAELSIAHRLWTKTQFARVVCFSMSGGATAYLLYLITPANTGDNRNANALSDRGKKLALTQHY